MGITTLGRKKIKTVILARILFMVFGLGHLFSGYASPVSDSVSAASVSEVIQKTPTRVVVREHPRTGRPYVSIVSSEAPARDPFSGLHQAMKRPDYRMLDPKIKAGQIPYEGPYSDRKKVYLLAASLATVGAVEIGRAHV